MVEKWARVDAALAAVCEGKGGAGGGCGGGGWGRGGVSGRLWLFHHGVFEFGNESES